jgi:hypothetical protein
MIRYITFFLASIIALLKFDLGWANDTDISQFEKKLFEPTQISKRITLPPQPHGELSERDKQDLMEARRVLIDFLKSLKDARDSMTYLLPSLKENYRDVVDMYKQEFRGAEAIVSVAIDDYVIKRNKDEVVFYTEVTTTAYGEDFIKPKAFALKKTVNGWKLSRFNQNIQSREIEEREIKK